ncbi:hypothetical protein [Aliiroseovarius crassostreae]|uniref:hypothetical protein n=1 Tax=Aliiroseovarius crassostreae TaxID=154981 RepID=UPI002207C05C|nr:hypothetical protein [Aliiroseovarius crassostreae]UWQ04725.1 hypothetical protein K3X22_14000 [Aliiroseovarius crassostreae]
MTQIAALAMPNPRTKPGKRTIGDRRLISGWWILPVAAFAIPMWIVLLRIFLSLF